MSKIVGNAVGIPNPQSDWNQTLQTKADYIKNKPKIKSNNTKAFLIKSYTGVEGGVGQYTLDGGENKNELISAIRKAINNQDNNELYFSIVNQEHIVRKGKIHDVFEDVNGNIVIGVSNFYANAHNSGYNAGNIYINYGKVLAYENKTYEGGLTNHKDTFWSVCEDVSKYKSLRFKARTSDIPYLAFSFMKKDGTWVHNAGNKDALIKLNQGTQFEEYYLDLTSFPEWNGEVEYIHITQKTPDWQSGYKGTVEFAEITLDEHPIESWDFEDYNSQRWKISDWQTEEGNVTLIYANGEMTYTQTIKSGGRAFAIWNKSFVANDYKALKIRVKSPDGYAGLKGVYGLNLDVRGTLSNGVGNIWYTSIRDITNEYQDFIIDFADSDNWKDSIISRLSFLLVDAKGEDTTGTVVIDSIELIPNDNITYDNYTWDFETAETCLWESPNRQTSKVTYIDNLPELGYSIQNRGEDGIQGSLYFNDYPELGTITLAREGIVLGRNNQIGENVSAFGENINALEASDSLSCGEQNIISNLAKKVFQFGKGLVSKFPYQFQLGKFNNNKERNLLEVGFGDNALDTKNVFEIDKNGLIYSNEKLISGQKIFDITDMSEVGGAIEGVEQDLSYGIVAKVDANNIALEANACYCLSCKITFSNIQDVGIRGFTNAPNTQIIESPILGVNYIHYIINPKDYNYTLPSKFGIAIDQYATASDVTDPEIYTDPIVEDVKLLKLKSLGVYEYDCLISENVNILDELYNNKKIISDTFDAAKAIYKIGDELMVACDEKLSEMPLNVYTINPNVKKICLNAGSNPESIIVRSPIISENDTWLIWNSETSAYEETGVFAKGQKGKDGYTPQKEVDYWTEADKAEIRTYIDDATGDIETALNEIINIQNTFIGGEIV